MRRRTVLQGSAALGSTLLWRPAWSSGAASDPLNSSMAQGHDLYFSKLNSLLRKAGPGRPVMLIDEDALHHNIDAIAASVGKAKTWRVVVKSLPSVPLLRAVLKRARTNALMVFHQPFLNEIARSFPDADVLIGKPMPVNAVRTFYADYSAEPRRRRRGFDPERQVQWLIDSPERLLQYQALARELGVHLRVSFEIDVGLHRGGFNSPEELQVALKTIQADPKHLSVAGLMGYEPHLTGLKATLDHPAVESVLSIYRGFVELLASAGYPAKSLTLNGAGSHTLKIYEQDTLMNDLSAGSGVVMPTDFDTHHLTDHRPALFIATPILKRYAGNPYLEDPPETLERLYYIYGGYWKANIVSPVNTGEPIYQSTNQSPVTTSSKVDLQVDDYMFLRPTQSEFVMLQFGDLLTVRGDAKTGVAEPGEPTFGESWPVFHQTG